GGPAAAAPRSPPMFSGRDWRTALRARRRSANRRRRGLHRWWLLSQTNAEARRRPHVGNKLLSMSMAASDYLRSGHGPPAVVAAIVHKRRGIPFRVISRPYRLSARLSAGGLPRFRVCAYPRGTFGEHREASPKNISASGRGRRRAPGDVAHRNGASL